MYTTKNFKTKKALKQAVAERVAFLAALDKANTPVALPVTVYQPNADLTNAQVPSSGRVTLEGPHYPEPHCWYATAILENGEVVKVS